MQYASLGRTGLQVSQLCLGTMNFGPRTPEPDAITMIHHAIAQGINFIDTANIYGRPLKEGKGQGISEQIVGRALQSQARDRIILATKVGIPMPRHGDDPNHYGYSRVHIMQQIDESLERLQTDYIDLYQLHYDFREFPLDETLRTLDDLVRAGKVRYIGLSNFAAWRVVQSLWTSAEHHLARVVSLQPPYAMIFRSVERELFPMAAQFGLGVMPWSPLWGGILTDKFYENQGDSADSRAQFERWQNIWYQNLDPNVMPLLEVLHTYGQAHGYTISQIALKWVQQQSVVTSPIIGPRTMQQLDDNLAALDVELSDDLLQTIDELAPPGNRMGKLSGH